MREGTVVLGVSSGALFDELAWAEKDQGAWLNGERLHVSDVSVLQEAAVSTGNLKSLAAGGGWQRFGELVTEVDRIRGYGDFYQYHLLAAGKIDAVIESDVNILDIAALAVIVQEAGGVFTDLNGAPVGLGTRSVLAANKRLHADILPRLEGYVR
jgi:histidinol-phosphatase